MGSHVDTAKTSHGYPSSRSARLSAPFALLAALAISLAVAGCDSVPTDLGLPDGASDKSDAATASAVANIRFETYQPDHTKITLVFRGDEHYHWYEDSAGYTVVLTGGDYRYATLDANAELVATEWGVGRDDPAAHGLAPGLQPPQYVIDRIRSESTVQPIAFVEPAADDVADNFTVIEGDMLVPSHVADAAKHSASGSVYYNIGQWTNGIVPYTFDANVSAGNQTAMRAAMDDWEAVADVHFIPRTGEANYVNIFSGTGNWSYVGMIGGKQDLSIYNWNWEFIMAHELAHAVGVWHEQSRSDRDTYVQINWGNITAGKENNFNIHNAWYDSDIGTYDFDSVMHYGAYSFSNNGQPTIQAQPAYAGTSFGQRTHLSVSDTTSIAAIYGASVPSVKATMTTPANSGATLTGSGFTFAWDAGSNVSEYWLWLGSAAGTHDILSGGTGSGTSLAAAGLPTDGSTVHVRLFSMINGAWQTNDYDYVAHNAPSSAAAMTTPANSGATLTGSGFTFVWDTGSNVSEYWLWIGSGAGTNDILSQGSGAGTSLAVTGLPTDGSTVHVRLFSMINGAWQTNDYNYVAHNAPSSAAAMTTPANTGATLTGSGFTFVWDTGSNVSEYWLWIGSSAGSNDILSQGSGAGTSLAVTGLPTDGSTVHVRLFSMINDAWQTNDYNYVAHNVPSSAAAMTTPANSGATLTGSGFTFVWDTGSNVSEYWLWIGSGAGTNDILSQGSGAATSLAVTGLPTDGSTVHVRLFSMINGAWQTNDYNYVAHNVPSAAATMTTPANNGVTLNGSSYTFAWTAGQNVTQYWLWFGSSLGTNDISSVDGGVGTSLAVSGLPTDGSTVYVRLFSLINGSWQTNDYNYVAFTGASDKAVMTTPASSGATLSGSNLTFVWTTGSNVSEYWLWIGSTVGNNDMLSQSAGAGTSLAVTGLPTDGSTIHVRLFSMIDGSWQTNDYNYVTGP